MCYKVSQGIVFILVVLISLAYAGPVVADSPTPVVTAQSIVVRVDVGGSGYHDPVTGLTWEADRPYTPAADGSLGWGYWGPRSMQVIATTHPVAGTSASRVYQTQRIGMTGYRFDLPNGSYRVTVRLAELYTHINGGSNVYHVFCQGQRVLSNVDVAKKVGKYVADDRIFTTTVTDGVLYITFAVQKGWVAIAGLDVESLPQLTTPIATQPTATMVISPTAGVTATISTLPPVPTPSPSVLTTPAGTKPPAPTPAVTETTTSATATVAPSATPTPSVTSTSMAMPEVTPTLSATPTSPVTPQATPTPSGTLSATASATLIPSNTVTFTPIPSPTPSATPTVVPTSTPTATPSETTMPIPSPTLVATPTERPELPPPPAGMERLTQDSFSVVFKATEREGALDVLAAMAEIKERLITELGISVGSIEVRLFSTREEYNQELGMTAPADQVGNIADLQHIWLLTPRRAEPNEHADILKGVQVEVVRLALALTPNLPTWLRDGIASYEARLWNEARDQYMRALVAMRRVIGVRALEGASYNYLGGAVTAHTVVDYLVNTYGSTKIGRLLELLPTHSLDQAFQEAIGVSLAEFERGWVNYVLKTYGK